jgi:choline-sulfatase
MLARGEHKLVAVHGQPDQLYNVVADPGETRNLADDAQQGATLHGMQLELNVGWDPEAIRRDVLASQAERRAVIGALRLDPVTAWDYQPPPKASEQYVRLLNAQQTASAARVPRLDYLPRDKEQS